MSIKSILVNIHIDGPVAPIVKAAADLARRTNARLIALAAADAPPPVVTVDGMVMGMDLMDAQRSDIKKRLDEIAGSIKGIAGDVAVEWRGTVGHPSDSLVLQARAADLVMTNAPNGPSVGATYRSIDLGSVILHAGRPVLVVADGVEHVALNKGLVAWKDTRESRRALVDALPLLGQMQEVVVVTVDRDSGREAKASVDDAVALLSLHGVKARGEVVSEGDDSSGIIDLAKSVHADLVVSGAYGHSRLREWVFGGVTRSLLKEPALTRFMSN